MSDPLVPILKALEQKQHAPAPTDQSASGPTPLAAGAAARRQPGAQPGNQNARKTGLYSRYLPAEEFAELVQVRGLKEEIALVRVRIRDLLAAGASTQDFFEAIDLLHRLIATNYRINGRYG